MAAARSRRAMRLRSASTATRFCARRDMTRTRSSNCGQQGPWLNASAMHPRPSDAEGDDTDNHRHADRPGADAHAADGDPISLVIGDLTIALLVLAFRVAHAIPRYRCRSGFIRPIA